MSRFGDLLRGGAPAPKVEAAPAPEPVKEEDPVLEEMTKDELEELGRKRGVELDKRHSKKTLIKELEELETNNG